MKECKCMYVLQGIQYCMYPDINCKYKGNTLLMSFLVNGVMETGYVTCCDINLINDVVQETSDSELEQLLEGLEGFDESEGI